MTAPIEARRRAVSADHITVLTTAGRDHGKLATKRISRDRGDWLIEDYSLATWWSVRQVEAHDLVSLGRALADLERASCSCLIRGEPLPGINPARTRRLKDAAEDGTPPSFAPAARRWFAIDFDSLPTPIWNPGKLARRRAAIERDRAEHPHRRPKTADDGERSTSPPMMIRPRSTRPATGRSSSAQPSSPCR
jgi:hypothetical protein